MLHTVTLGGDSVQGIDADMHPLLRCIIVHSRSLNAVQVTPKNLLSRNLW